MGARTRRCTVHEAARQDGDRSVAGPLADLRGCQFNRNGKWYKGAEAHAFLAQKFAMLDAQGGASSTEQFIDLAASKSGTSGQPYRVRCNPAAAVESNVWLRDQLSALRQDAIGARP